MKYLANFSCVKSLKDYAGVYLLKVCLKAEFTKISGLLMKQLVKPLYEKVIIALKINYSIHSLQVRTLNLRLEKPDK